MIEKKFTVLAYIIALQFFSLDPICAQSKNSSCKATKRANRNKTVIVDRPDLITFSWNDISDPKTIITRYVGQKYDSVTVYNDGKLVSSFLVKLGMIISPEYIQYDTNGSIYARIQSDTIDISSHLYRYYGPEGNGYFTFHTWKKSLVKERFFEDGNLKSKMYYGNTGKDSLFYEWYPNGGIKFKYIHELLLEFWPDGILKRKSWFPDYIWEKYEKTGEIPQPPYFIKYNEYNTFGILNKIVDDTMIIGNLLIRVRNYSDAGIIRSVHYFKDVSMTILKLCPDESLMVIRGTINEMSEDLLLAPFFRPGLNCKIFFRDIMEKRRDYFTEMAEAVERLQGHWLLICLLIHS